MKRKETKQNEKKKETNDVNKIGKDKKDIPKKTKKYFPEGFKPSIIIIRSNCSLWSLTA